MRSNINTHVKLTNYNITDLLAHIAGIEAAIDSWIFSIRTSFWFIQGHCHGNWFWAKFAKWPLFTRWLCWSHWWTLQIQLYQSRCHLGYGWTSVGPRNHVLVAGAICVRWQCELSLSLP